MTEPETDRPSDDQLLQEAAAWFARMRGPEAEGSRADFDAWLARGALHRRAYNRAAEIFAMGKVLGEEQPAARPSLPTHRGLTMKNTIAAGALALAAVAALWVVERPPAMFSAPRAARTDRGTQVAEFSAPADATRQVRLADGSLVRLQGGTRLGVAFDGSIRRLVLRVGRARFEVAHEARPFIVYAGGGSVTAHGTVFDVSLSRDRLVSVRLIEGTVDVTLPSATKTNSGNVRPRQLHKGEAISYLAHGAAGMIVPTAGEPTKQSQATGAVEQLAHDYDDVRVADLIAQANRRASRPIRLAEAAVADQRISGRFRIDDTDLLAERIAALFGLVVDRSDPREILLRRQ